MIEATFINPTLLTSHDITRDVIPWNDIFIDIAYYYLNILSVIFHDFSTSSHQSIKLIISSKINKSNLQDQLYKTIFLIKRGNIYNPIFKADSIIYFKTKVFEQKLFQHSDNINSIIIKVDEFNKSEMVTETVISLDIYRQFSTQSKKYALSTFYVNNDNQCYYIKIIESAGTKPIYIPVRFSAYVREKGIDVVYDTFKVAEASSFKLINDFIKDFNKWLFTKHKATTIKIDEWIYLDNVWSRSKQNDVIGFIHDGLNYYHAPLSYAQAKKIEDIGFKRILYHPDKINKSLESKVSLPDQRTKNIIQNTYDYHIYELLLLEYTVLLNKEKNGPLRHEIKKLILKMTSANAKSSLDSIISLITAYYDKYPDQKIYMSNDIQRISIQVNTYLIKHRNKKDLLNQINLYTYMFDKILHNELKTMSKDSLIKLLRDLAKKVVKVMSPQAVHSALKKKKEFPNMMISCYDNDANYCKDNKLMITQSNLNTLLDIMAADILNPFKSKWIFNSLFTDNVISYLKFKRRNNEVIEIYPADDSL